MRARPVAILGVACVALLFAERGGADAAGGPTERVLPLFTIAKSENRNQVQYVVRLDEECRPLGDAPIYAYWRMLEKGPNQTEPLLPQEIDAYGIATQAVLDRAVTVAADGAGGATSSRVRLVLRAVRAREITVDTHREESGTCAAFATVRINGEPAHLFDVYAKLRWPFGVDYLMLRGWSLDGSHVLSEKLAK